MSLLLGHLKTISYHFGRLKCLLILRLSMSIRPHLTSITLYITAQSENSGHSVKNSIIQEPKQCKTHLEIESVVQSSRVNVNLDRIRLSQRMVVSFQCAHRQVGAQPGEVAADHEIVVKLDHMASPVLDRIC